MCVRTLTYHILPTYPFTSPFRQMSSHVTCEAILDAWEGKIYNILVYSSCRKRKTEKFDRRNRKKYTPGPRPKNIWQRTGKTNRIPPSPLFSFDASPCDTQFQTLATILQLSCSKAFRSNGEMFLCVQTVDY